MDYNTFIKSYKPTFVPISYSSLSKVINKDVYSIEPQIFGKDTFLFSSEIKKELEKRKTIKNKEKRNEWFVKISSLLLKGYEHWKPTECPVKYRIQQVRENKKISLLFEYDLYMNVQLGHAHPTFLIFETIHNLSSFNIFLHKFRSKVIKISFPILFNSFHKQKDKSNQKQNKKNDHKDGNSKPTTKSDHDSKEEDSKSIHFKKNIDTKFQILQYFRKALNYLSTLKVIILLSKSSFNRFNLIRFFLFDYLNEILESSFHLISNYLQFVSDP
ncbi:hypothetical protein M0813_20106 [Anaeramoeba flamelloides]|uniref:Uncharacterized protein n=1 Tax=Anaeramoeba flamelloides TaxID=1746091 RepID=A0ABQ8YM56_9EUKA|nr:hypothetical protein M0813_20106 [Anaeramoeba flamelloides]